MAPPLTYFAGDDRPAWQATVTVNGTADDLSTGFTFTVKIIKNNTVLLTKVNGISGAAGGVVTVAWTPNELALSPGKYVAQLNVTRTADVTDWTVTELLIIRPRY